MQAHLQLGQHVRFVFCRQRAVGEALQPLLLGGNRSAPSRQNGICHLRGSIGHYHQCFSLVPKDFIRSYVASKSITCARAAASLCCGRQSQRSATPGWGWQPGSDNVQRATVMNAASSIWLQSARLSIKASCGNFIFMSVAFLNM